MPGPLKYSKSFEGHGPVLALAVHTEDSSGKSRKLYLILDANQESFGVRIEAERFEEVKTTGAVVALLRKYAKSGIVAAIYHDRVQGDFWLPLFIQRSEQPSYWLQLAFGSPPELRLVDPAGIAIVRKSSKATYTKRWPLSSPLPSYPPGPAFVDISGDLRLPAENVAAAIVDHSESMVASVSPLLPDYQRGARDRLARRLKTLRKAREKLERQRHTQTSVAKLEQQASLLQAFLSRIAIGDHELSLSPEDTGLEVEMRIPLDPQFSPGQNLSDVFKQVKKAKKAAIILDEQIKSSDIQYQALSADLDRIRAFSLPLGEVAAMLERHQLPPATGGGGSPAGEQKVPYRTFHWRPEDADKNAAPISILVGKSAADSDELCRMAKGNDLWLHIVGSTGSHIIIPAKGLKKAPPPSLIRTAAILAVHFSKLRADQCGEVYFSRRQNIKKRRGMAPGLWQVVQAETLFVRFGDDELQTALSLGT